MHQLAANSVKILINIQRELVSAEFSAKIVLRKGELDAKLARVSKYISLGRSVLKSEFDGKRIIMMES